MTRSGEPTDLSSYGIKHNKCVDDELMAHLFNDDTGLMDYIGTDVMDDVLSEKGYLNVH